MTDGPSWRDTALKLLQIAAMPIALALVGWWIQSAINEDNLEVERLKLAVGILTSEDADPAVRQYGAALLEVSSPPGLLTDELREKLAAGETILPAEATRGDRRAAGRSRSLRRDTRRLTGRSRFP